MDGLLDFVKTPEGQGLLSAAFGGLAGARRGAPVNTLGIAGLAGLSGYSNAQQRGVTEQYRNMQAQQIQASLKKQQMAMDMAQRMFGGQSAPGASQDGAMQPDSMASSGAAPSSMPQSQGRQPQSAFPLGLNDVAAYNMLDLPNGSTILDLYKQANNPQERKGGNYYVDPRTGKQTYMPKMAEGVMMNEQGQAMPVPGAAQANAGYKGAEAGSVAAAQFPWAVGQKAAEQRGAASYDPMKVIGQDGNEYFVPRLDVAAGAGGAAPGQGGGFMAARNPINQSATQDLNKNWITNTYQPTLDSGKSAADMRNSIQSARNIDLRTGYGTEAKALGANVLTSLGIAPKNAELFASNAQKFQSVAMDRLLTVLGAQKGQQTEGDADRASKTFVSLKNTPEANTFILDLAEAKANQDARKAQFYQDALPQAQKEGDLMRIDREWRNIQGSIWNDPILSRWQKR
ncbi:hypothetical protein MKZ87_13885 [Pseudomonas sp. MCal1]|uniref:hypothetical protein n=1 Tax=Pseudomonas sp. MCal1 TaxID=2919887 RepID=UPI00225B7346|nr:hypothetical protein [Pseudomonas sp. MCal1]MCX4218730.1 hypothetical protein [Pseudomonas sp. MCal1]